MATTCRALTRTSLRLLRPIEPTKSLASELRGPQTANLPFLAPTLHLFARASCSKQRRPPQPNLHSPNSRPAVQCNEGFCNAPERSALDLDYKHGVAETSPLCERAKLPGFPIPGAIGSCLHIRFSRSNFPFRDIGAAVLWPFNLENLA